MKRVILLTSLLLFLAVGAVFAQSYQTVQTSTTRVGNPPVTSGNRPQIADTIVQRLTRGSDGYFNKINPNPFHYPGSSYVVKERGPNPPGYEDSTDAGYIFCTSLV